jgi:hypothetical protein
LSSVGQEISTNVDHTISTTHHLVVCPTLSSNNSDTSASDLSISVQAIHSPPNYSQQPLALTTNDRLNNNNKSISMNKNSRKETFPINHIRQHLIPTTTTTTTSNNNTPPYIKL